MSGHDCAVVRTANRVVYSVAASTLPRQIMLKAQKLKKSESLEIRIPYPTKQAFMARCREDGRSASEALRGFIEGRLDDPSGPASPTLKPVVRGSRRRLHMIAGAVIAALVGAAALPTLARPSLRSEFERLDANGDGDVTLEELSRGASVDIRFSVGGTGPKRGDAALDAQVRSLLLRAEFRRIDADGDGKISFEEYRRRFD